jgi:hypothetical protein
MIPQTESFQNLTYDQLYVYIQQYLKRSDTVTLESIPKWINLGEKRLAKDLKNLGAVSILQFPITPDSVTIFSAGALIKKPYLWHQTKSMSVIDTTTNQRSYLLPRSYEWLQTYLDDFAGMDIGDIAVPTMQFYADYNIEYWLLGPYISTATIKGEVAYYGQTQPLSPENQTNFWTLYTPDVLIYAVLTEAASFLRVDERSTAVFEPRYQAGIAALLKEDAGRINDNSIMRNNT